MEKSTGRTIRLGIMVIVGAVLLTVAVYLIGQKQDMFSNTFKLRVIFNNVNGLQPGNNVRFSGINVGSVMSVTIQNDSTIEIVMRIKENVRKFIKKDALVTIGTDGLMGNMLVNISPGTGSAKSVQDNDLLSSFSRIKTDDILKTLNVTNENAAILTANLLEITQDIQHGKGAISYLVYDTMLRHQLFKAVVNLKTATEKTNGLLFSIQQLANEVQHGKGLAGWLLHDSTTAHQIGTTLNALQKSSLEIHESTDSLKSFMSRLSAGKGAIPSLMYDTMMVQDLRQTLINLNKGTAKFDENMEALKHSFLTRKYFKDQEKKKK